MVERANLAAVRFPIFASKPLLSTVLLVAASASYAQRPQIDSVLQQLEQVHAFSEVSISPDGRWISWTQPAPGNPSHSELFLMDWKEASAKPRRITAGDPSSSYRESGLAWSPDGEKIAFFSDAGSTQEQVFWAPISGEKPRRVTNLKGHVSALKWAPHGDQVSFLYAQGGGGGGPLEAVPAQTGVIGGETHNQCLTVVDTTDGQTRELSPAKLNIYEYDWAPDGRSAVALAAPGPADNNWWIAQLYLLDVATGQFKLIYHPPVECQIALPQWSPDGKQIAFIGGLMSDEGFNGGDIFSIDARGGEPRNLTQNRRSSVTSFQWRDRSNIVLTEAVDGSSAISVLNTANAQTETLWKGAEGIHEFGNYANFSLAKDGRTSALIRSSWERAPEVWAGGIGDWHQIAHANASQQPHWGKAESILWENEGFNIQGWLLYPQNYDSNRRYPMVVEIHGGPANLKTPTWPTARFDMSVMAGLGYFVFFPNPRGSYGGGEAFTRANVKDFGGGDLRDVLKGVDAVLGKVPVDRDRVGVTGWSYGGFMTMWTVTQTNRFRAAVAGAGIANWQSYYGENSIDEWMIPYFGTSVYEDPKVYAKSSPITYIKQVKTPTLVVVGERDGECPAPQSFEFWHALQSLSLPTQLVVYPGEGHSFHDPANRVDVLRRTLAWFDQYLGTAPGSTR